MTVYFHRHTRHRSDLLPAIRHIKCHIVIGIVVGKLRVVKTHFSLTINISALFHLRTSGSCCATEHEVRTGVGGNAVQRVKTCHRVRCTVVNISGRMSCDRDGHRYRGNVYRSENRITHAGVVSLIFQHISKDIILRHIVCHIGHARESRRNGQLITSRQCKGKSVSGGVCHGDTSVTDRVVRPGMGCAIIRIGHALGGNGQYTVIRCDGDSTGHKARIVISRHIIIVSILDHHTRDEHRRTTHLLPTRTGQGRGGRMDCHKIISCPIRNIRIGVGVGISIIFSCQTVGSERDRTRFDSKIVIRQHNRELLGNIYIRCIQHPSRIKAIQLIRTRKGCRIDIVARILGVGHCGSLNRSRVNMIDNVHIFTTTSSYIDSKTQCIKTHQLMCNTIVINGVTFGFQRISVRNGSVCDMDGTVYRNNGVVGRHILRRTDMLDSDRRWVNMDILSTRQSALTGHNNSTDTLSVANIIRLVRSQEISIAVFQTVILHFHALSRDREGTWRDAQITRQGCNVELVCHVLTCQHAIHPHGGIRTRKSCDGGGSVARIGTCGSGIYTLHPILESVKFKQVVHNTTHGLLIAVIHHRITYSLKHNIILAGTMRHLKQCGI